VCPSRGLTSRRTDWLNVSRNVNLTWVIFQSQVAWREKSVSIPVSAAYFHQPCVNEAWAFGTCELRTTFLCNIAPTQCNTQIPPILSRTRNVNLNNSVVSYSLLFVCQCDLGKLSCIHVWNIKCYRSHINQSSPTLIILEILSKHAKRDVCIRQSDTRVRDYIPSLNTSVPFR
jgi:hypothetical protein